MAGPQQRQNWEYLTLPTSQQNRLASLGREGWELAAAAGESHNGVLYLKRPLPDFRERVTLEQRASYFRARGLDPAPRTGGNLP